MKLSILVDNNSITDRYFRSEPALSVWVDDGSANILLDTGYSDAFLHNGTKMRLDFSRLDAVVLSHGHFDHTWGLAPLVAWFTEAELEGRVAERPRIVAHPEALEDKVLPEGGSIGSMFSAGTLSRFFPVQLSRTPVELSEHTVFLGEIPRRFSFEEPPRYNLRVREGVTEPDHLPDDSALAVNTAEGLVLVCGCAHAGVCNTLEYAREVTGQERVRAVYGGLHLLGAAPERLEETGRYLEDLGVQEIWPVHCVDLEAKRVLSRFLPVREAGTGMSIVFRDHGRL